MSEQSFCVKFNLVSGDFERAGEASSKIKKMLQQIGVASEIIRRIAIGTYEGEMNIIIHSNGGEIQAEFYSDYTEITVSDYGPGIEDISLALQEGYSTAPNYVREMGFGAGMGLPNMKRCADNFLIKSALGVGTEIKMKFSHK